MKEGPGRRWPHMNGSPQGLGLAREESRAQEQEPVFLTLLPCHETQFLPL